MASVLDSLDDYQDVKYIWYQKQLGQFFSDSSKLIPDNENFKVRIYNPNSAPITNYAMRLDLSEINTTNFTQGIVASVGGSDIPTLYENMYGALTTKYAEWNGKYIWVKIPSIGANTFLDILIQDKLNVYSTQDIFDIYFSGENLNSGFTISDISFNQPISPTDGNNFSTRTIFARVRHGIYSKDDNIIINNTTPTIAISDFTIDPDKEYEIIYSGNDESVLEFYITQDDNVQVIQDNFSYQAFPKGDIFLQIWETGDVTDIYPEDIFYDCGVSSDKTYVETDNDISYGKLVKAVTTPIKDEQGNVTATIINYYIRTYQRSTNLKINGNELCKKYRLTTFGKDYYALKAFDRYGGAIYSDRKPLSMLDVYDTSGQLLTNIPSYIKIYEGPNILYNNKEIKLNGYITAHNLNEFYNAFICDSAFDQNSHNILICKIDGETPATQKDYSIWQSYYITMDVYAELLDFSGVFFDVGYTGTALPTTDIIETSGLNDVKIAIKRYLVKHIENSFGLTRFANASNVGLPAMRLQPLYTKFKIPDLTNFEGFSSYFDLSQKYLKGGNWYYMLPYIYEAPSHIFVDLQHKKRQKPFLTGAYPIRLTFTVSNAALKYEYSHVRCDDNEIFNYLIENWEDQVTPYIPIDVTQGRLVIYGFTGGKSDRIYCIRAKQKLDSPIVQLMERDLYVVFKNWGYSWMIADLNPDTPTPAQLTSDEVDDEIDNAKDALKNTAFDEGDLIPDASKATSYTGIFADIRLLKYR